MTIKELRTQRELSQEAVSRKADISLRQVVRIENHPGSAGKMTFETFDALAMAFGVDHNTLGAVIKGVA